MVPAATSLASLGAIAMHASTLLGALEMKS
jgi:hypothetical protein